MNQINEVSLMLNDGVNSLPGIGPKKEKLLEAMGIRTIEDLLYTFPRTYQDRRQITPIIELQNNVTALVRARIVQIYQGRNFYGKKNNFKIVIDDGSGRCSVIFFNANYLRKILIPGNEYYFYGKTNSGRGGRSLIHPEFSSTSGEFEMGILPVYPLTAGMSQKELRRIMKMVYPLCDKLKEYLPEKIIFQNYLISISEAIKNIHCPKDESSFKNAKYRLVFDEFFIMQLGVLAFSLRKDSQLKGIKADSDKKMSEFTQHLKFKLTNAQKRTVDEVEHDMESPSPMNRLIQGDVGSGKTAVAEAALYKTVISGYQGALMAPTEILAKQHYSVLQRDFEPFGINVCLLTGSMRTGEKTDILEKIKTGYYSIVIGTHALIQKDVVFHKLGLTITDEQHRFGVGQRSLLSEKGIMPDRIVMTATPIPRTLAVVLYGDLDISLIDQLPGGRKPVVTRVYSKASADSAYQQLKSEIDKGHQAYIVCPLIEESDSLDVVSVEELTQKVKKRFGEYTVESLYGSMSQKEKDFIMNSFYAKDIDILVSTVVIEVGIDVPNATFMLVENAERFGLAQLHQLRGRVGRGNSLSYCALISDAGTEVSEKRLKIMEKTNDGFMIAEEDLKLRGPGEIFGTRQHGLPDLRLADPVKHIKIMNLAGDIAREVYAEDPILGSPENSLLKNRLESSFKKLEMINI